MNANKARKAQPSRRIRRQEEPRNPHARGAPVMPAGLLGTLLRCAAEEVNYLPLRAVQRRTGALTSRYRLGKAHAARSDAASIA
ncbi:hypothetical protein GCM10023195_71150 [Actinoallomurus liliacearum]|uniref:Uncharacterized protein n=2 Tax=Actinoallomurus liliacearum TaxID=1080073 RepID=A0ABP8TWN7_9ACTN